MSHFNTAGTLMFLAAFGAAYGIMRGLGVMNEGLVMLVAGPLLAIADLLYRRHKHVRLLRGAGGGTFLLLPVWLWGVFWTGLGAFYYVRG